MCLVIAANTTLHTSTTHMQIFSVYWYWCVCYTYLLRLCFIYAALTCFQRFCVSHTHTMVLSVYRVRKRVVFMYVHSAHMYKQHIQRTTIKTTTPRTCSALQNAAAAATVAIVHIIYIHSCLRTYTNLCLYTAPYSYIRMVHRYMLACLRACVRAST